MSEEEKTRVDLNPVQVVASALAAVSSAVLLSTVGVAGTVIGAAAGSVIATVCTGIYSYSLKVSRQRVAAAAQAAAMARFARGGRPDGDTTQQLPTQEVERQRSEEEKAARPPWREALAALPWKWVAIVAGAVFVIAMVVILSFELLTGRAVSQLTGGTSNHTDRTSLDWGGSKSTPTPSATPSGSATPTSSASPSASTSPSESATPSETPTESATPSDTASPSESVTGTPSTTATASPSSPTG